MPGSTVTACFVLSAGGTSRYHVRCVRCGRVDDVEVPNLASLEEEAARTSGYQICGHTLQFDGICPECQKS